MTKLLKMYASVFKNSIISFLFAVTLFDLQHSRVYDSEEYNHRLNIFTENKRIIDHHNAGNHSFTSTVLFGTNSSLIVCVMYGLLLQCGHCSSNPKTKGMHVFKTFFIFNLVSLNQFSDMTFEEFRKLFLLTEPQVRSILQYNTLHASGAYILYLCLFDYSILVLVSCRTVQLLKGVT